MAVVGDESSEVETDEDEGVDESSELDEEYQVKSIEFIEGSLPPFAPIMLLFEFEALLLNNPPPFLLLLLHTIVVLVTIVVPEMMKLFRLLIGS